jgi:hypothetical protein
MKKSILLLASTLLLAASCGDDDEKLTTDQLPHATMIGANTFGCKVNGEVWIPHIEGGGAWDNPIYAKHYLAINHPILGECDQLQVSGKRKYNGQANINQVITINVWCPKIGENEITPTSGVFIDFINCGYYQVDTLNPHVLFLTRLDSLNYIASGTFEFTAINDDCNDTLRITEGRFDVNTRP